MTLSHPTNAHDNEEHEFTGKCCDFVCCCGKTKKDSVSYHLSLFLYSSQDAGDTPETSIVSNIFTMQACLLFTLLIYLHIFITVIPSLIYAE